MFHFHTPLSVRRKWNSFVCRLVHDEHFRCTVKYSRAVAIEAHSELLQPQKTLSGDTSGLSFRGHRGTIFRVLGKCGTSICSAVATVRNGDAWTVSSCLYGCVTKQGLLCHCWHEASLWVCGKTGTPLENQRVGRRHASMDESFIFVFY
jgi:hypothetical protein